MPAHSSGATVLKSSEGDAEDVVLVDDDVGGVAALGDGAVPVDGTVGLRVAVQAVLLLPGPAVLTFAAGVDDGADPDPVTDGVLGHVGADLGDGAGDLVADDLGVGDRPPVAADGVDVGVADPGVSDLDQHVVGSDVTAGDGGRHQGVGRRGRGVGVDGQHRWVPFLQVSVRRSMGSAKTRKVSRPVCIVQSRRRGRRGRGWGVRG